MTVKQYDQFLADFVKGDTIVDSQWLQKYFRQHEALVRSNKQLQERYDLLATISDRTELIRLDITC